MDVRFVGRRQWYGRAMAPLDLPNPLDLATSGVRTLRAFTSRLPIGGGVIAPSLEGAVRNKTVMITGASSGIGEATALQVGRARGTVLLVARREDQLNEV